MGKHRIKTPQELGYIIPVLSKIGIGRYKIAHTKSLKPNKRNLIKVRYKSGRTSYWNAENVVDYNLKAIQNDR